MNVFVCVIAHTYTTHAATHTHTRTLAPIHTHHNTFASVPQSSDRLHGARYLRVTAPQYAVTVKENRMDRA